MKFLKGAQDIKIFMNQVNSYNLVSIFMIMNMEKRIRRFSKNSEDIGKNKVRQFLRILTFKFWKESFMGLLDLLAAEKLHFFLQYYNLFLIKGAISSIAKL